MTKKLPEGEYLSLKNGYRIHYHDHGSGPVVVFLHGSGPGASGFSNFQHNYPFLVEQGRRTIIPDHIGYGFSSKPEDETYTLDFFVDCLKEALDALHIHDCTLVGNSLGGAIAIQLALRFPELVRSMILMAPGGIEEREAYFAMEGIQGMMKAFLSEEGIDTARMRELLRLQLFNPALVTEELVEQRMEILRLQNKQVLATMQVPNLAPRLGELRCPILGFWGMDDRFCPVSGVQVMMENCRDTELRFISQSRCGHWFMVEYAQLFNRLCLDFLRNG